MSGFPQRFVMNLKSDAMCNKTTNGAELSLGVLSTTVTYFWAWLCE